MFKRLLQKLKNKTVEATEEEDDYIVVLVDFLKEAKENRKKLPFKIVDEKHGGFLVKVGGMFAFLHFKNMPWQYKSIHHWSVVAEHLVDCEFTASIRSISGYRKPVLININARYHIFDKKDLIPNDIYRCIVVQKVRYGVFVDLGLHFNWEFGSLVSLIHYSSFVDNMQLKEAKAGSVLDVRYLGKGKNGDLIVGEDDVDLEWATGELEKYIGTTKLALKMRDGMGKKVFMTEGKYKTVIRVNKTIFPEHKSTKKKLRALHVNKSVLCKIIGISTRKLFLAELVSLNPSEDILSSN